VCARVRLGKRSHAFSVPTTPHCLPPALGHPSPGNNTPTHLPRSLAQHFHQHARCRRRRASKRRAHNTNERAAQLGWHQDMEARDRHAGHETDEAAKQVSDASSSAQPAHPSCASMPCAFATHSRLGQSWHASPAFRAGAARLHELRVSLPPLSPAMSRCMHMGCTKCMRHKMHAPDVHAQVHVHVHAQVHAASEHVLVARVRLKCLRLASSACAFRACTCALLCMCQWRAADCLRDQPRAGTHLRHMPLTPHASHTTCHSYTRMHTPRPPLLASRQAKTDTKRHNALSSMASRATLRRRTPQTLHSQSQNTNTLHLQIGTDSEQTTQHRRL